MPAVISTIAVIGANVIGGAMAMPQAIRLMIHRRSDGVSPAWAAVGLTVNAWWLIYGVGAGGSSWAIIPISLVSIASYGVIVTMIVRLASQPRAAIVSMLGMSVVIAAIAATSLVLGDWPVLGVALGSIYGIQLTPAVIAIYRSTDLSGVSTTTWVLAWLEALLWGVYGFPPRDAGILTFAATGLLMSTVVLVGLTVRKPRQPETDVPVASLRTDSS